MSAGGSGTLWKGSGRSPMRGVRARGGAHRERQDLGNYLAGVIHAPAVADRDRFAVAKRGLQWPLRLLSVAGPQDLSSRARLPPRYSAALRDSFWKVAQSALASRVVVQASISASLS